MVTNLKIIDTFCTDFKLEVGGLGERYLLFFERDMGEEWK
jgi:hypothetical protein